ncbi:DUF2164 domain-containing protein [Salirhabdus salicampi]|uniref:DUF2164 domain-containing protein n=1 Tax=Salirhabdus salicampi TaxID=476102 RepID=UPI0020C432EB|nr:DUF2164 domain-containing protein [Salirhabdus salicampi]MCP8615859.1 DUF2164 domain-containing protein [Salirhabdus salicampi]
MNKKLTKETRNHMIREIQTYFSEERSENIGDLAGENLLVFIEEKIAPHYFNQGIEETKVMIEQKVMNIEEDIDSLKRPLQLKRR